MDDAPIAYFESRAAAYRQRAERGVWAWQRGREAAAVMALAGDAGGRAVLDLGCGTGYYARRFVAAGACPVVAVDASPSMLAAIGDPAVTPVAGDAATVAVEQRFDIVVAAGLMEFVADPGAVLANARRHLKPDGRLVVLVPPENAAGRLYRRFHRRHGFTVRLYPGDVIAALGAANGLRLTNSRRVFPYSDVHMLVMS